MQDRPGKEVLLDAVATFLVQQVRSAIPDPGLSFRVLIAANLVNIVATEIRTGAAQDEAEHARLRELLPEEPDGTTDVLNAALVRVLKGGALDDDRLARIASHTKQTLLEKLAVTNPRFDTALDVEGT